jgi:uncharacterized membrane protein
MGLLLPALLVWGLGAFSLLFYPRLAATVFPVMPDVGVFLVLVILPIVALMIGFQDLRGEKRQRVWDFATIALSMMCLSMIIGAVLI